MAKPTDPSAILNDDFNRQSAYFDNTANGRSTHNGEQLCKFIFKPI